ncbi:Dot/Icm T4SS effector AnkI/LegAS4 [Legionella oakridgensis]|uniref:Protein containing SET domain n=2 Tax=Legionella oakridgensis TaxID=29423 RepID=W0BCY2_9GAMM|nr:Dot/Icm T4SS effector AnkI/LegAS4 [Legionella oakridgensis]AHE67730.1 protein containing SET domain [Legionella oakridgensis ATCC 33761 = DSM 21215]ETO92693.1 SET domain protein [Legionella oakridgensis RV-2-2007]KTD36940.1 eukaryotic huntingtin interacting protein B [Legionella oakridgensis]STY20751.1 eukaryotic huntingtin interacting protein B [Legionella longbeachae]
MSKFYPYRSVKNPTMPYSLRSKSARTRKSRVRKLPERFRDYTLTSNPFAFQFSLDESSKKRHFDSDHGRAKKGQVNKRGRVKEHDDAVDTESTMYSLGISNMHATDYLPSPLDKPELCAVRPVNLLKAFGGYGLYATVTIPAETCLGEYTGREFTIDEFERYLETEPGANPSYAMDMDNRIIDARIAGNFTRFINFSDSQANVEFREGRRGHQRVVMVVATKPIYAGEQILVDYNKYDEHASKDYYFLNPQDSWQSTWEMYEEHCARYERVRYPIVLDYFHIAETDKVYSTKLGMMVLEGAHLDESVEELADEVNLPYLKMDSHRRILDASETDLFTPLMMACFLGQVENVQWLIEHGACIDQQQNHSGNCPLFFALEGYRRDESRRPIFLEIMRRLILQNANPAVHDRADLTFLHKAISVLAVEDLGLVISWLTSQPDRDFTALYEYLNDQDNDLILHCLKNKLFGQFGLLLSAYPTYFEDNYTKADEEDMAFYTQQFKKATEAYSEAEIECLLECLTGAGIELQDELREAVGLPAASSAIRL